jgi:hypothetical protein
VDGRGVFSRLLSTPCSIAHTLNRPGTRKGLVWSPNWPPGSGQVIHWSEIHVICSQARKEMFREGGTGSCVSFRCATVRDATDSRSSEACSMSEDP